jgi:hypothetical protein
VWYVVCGMWHVACGIWYVVCWVAFQADAESSESTQRELEELHAACVTCLTWIVRGGGVELVIEKYSVAIQRFVPRRAH